MPSQDVDHTVGNGSSGVGDPWERIGELEAAVADLRTLLEESGHRESLLRDALEASSAGPSVGELEMIRLQERLDECSLELQTIRRSRGWRLIQWLRGLVGRRW